MTQDRFEELVGVLLDDDISRDQLDELVKIATTDAVKQQRLREPLIFSDRLSQYEDEIRGEERFLSALQVRAHAAEDTEDFLSQVVASIHEESSRQSSQSSSPHVRTRRPGWQRNFALVLWATLAVAVMCLVGTLVDRVINGGRDGSPQLVDGIAAEPVDVNDTGVAVLTRVAGLEGGKTSTWHVGQTVPPGTMTWDAGLLQLEFYGGATVVAEGPAEIEILDESRVVCRLGRLRAHVPRAGTWICRACPLVRARRFGHRVRPERPRQRGGRSACV